MVTFSEGALNRLLEVLVEVKADIESICMSNEEEYGGREGGRGWWFMEGEGEREGKGGE